MRGSRLRFVALSVACLLAALALPSGLRAQQITVQGTVIGAGTNQPISGATIVVQGATIGGTTVGTTANDSGAFTLRVPAPNATLVVSRIGFIKETVPLNGRTTITITMTRVAVTLSDVVVVGYGTQKRSDVTGSVASITPERLQGKPNVSIGQALEGSIPGVTVSTSGSGAEPNLSILVRGRNSITASTEPLIVVDGIPYSGSLSEINQNDIASIDVLKDASASAIYGSRGSNGVILITSKRGNSGRPRIAYSGYVGNLMLSNKPHLMTGPEFAAFKCQRLNGGQNCDQVLTPTELTNLDAGKYVDWLDLATQTGSQQNHNLSFSGGNDDTKYYLGGSLLQVDGVARNDRFNRQTVRINLDQKLRSWLNLGTNTQMSRTNRGGISASFTDAFYANPLINPYAADGSPSVTPWPEDPVTNNPLQGLLVKNDDIQRRIFTSNYLQVNLPIKGLSYRLNGGLDYSDRKEGTFYGRNTQTGLAVQGSAITENSNHYDWTLENILRYTRSFGKHNFDLTTLYSTQQDNFEADSLRAQGFPNDVLTYYQPNVAALLLPSTTVVDSKLHSQMGRLNYNYNDRYLATLTARRDGYSGFGRNEKYGTFPSMALGWNISNEHFWPFTDAINSMKLRLSYGASGNQAIRPYQTLSQLDDRSYLNGEITAPGYIPVTLGNPNLHWETTNALDVGTDLALWKNRVTATVDVYNSRTRDLLLRRAISPVHGITSVTENIGKTQNRGFEFQISSLNLDRGSFSWHTDLSYSTNHNRILDLYGNGQSDILNGWFIGMPIEVNYAYKFAGIWQANDDIASSAQPTAKPGDVRILDLNGDGKITPDDRTFIGSLQPRYTAGLTNTFRYRHFTLSGFVTTVQGVTRSNNLLGSNQVFSDVRRNTLYLQYWTPTNPINTYPANSNTSNPLSVAFFENASYLRLKDLTLSFDLPTTVSNRFGAQSLRLYVNGRNLWTNTKWSGLDPELDNQRQVPLEKIVTGGLSVDF